MNANALKTQAAAAFWRDPNLWYHASLAWAYEAQESPSLLQSRNDLTAIRQAVALDPYNPEYLSEYARTLAFYDSPPEEVDAAFDAVYEVFPLSPDAHAGHAEYYIVHGDLDRASALLEDVRAMGSPEVWRVLARYHEARGDAEVAEQYRKQYEDHLLNYVR